MWRVNTGWVRSHSVCVDVHVQCVVERVLHVCVCVYVHVQCLVERVLHVCLCGCSCPVFG